MALVIVDMQRAFKASMKRRTWKPIVREIEIAKKSSEKIFVLCMDSYSFSYREKEILPFVQRNTSSYNNLFKVWKRSTSGAIEIVNLLNSMPSKMKQPSDKNMKIVGIETDCCVRSTAIALRKMNFNVKVITNACADVNDEKHHIGCHTMYKYGVRLFHRSS